MCPQGRGGSSLPSDTRKRQVRAGAAGAPRPICQQFVIDVGEVVESIPGDTAASTAGIAFEAAWDLRRYKSKNWLSGAYSTVPKPATPIRAAKSNLQAGTRETDQLSSDR